MKLGIAALKRRYGFARALIAPIVRRAYRYSAPEYDGPGAPTIVLSNSATPIDAALIAASFKGHMLFVTGGRASRFGLIDKFLKAYFKPIAKTASFAQHAEAISRALAAGVSACIFPEERRSFAGRPGYISPAIARYVKHSGAALITFNIDGGYLAMPRWAHKRRRGEITGRVVSALSANEVSVLNDADLHDIIVRDISVNAYERPRGIYRGKNLAESLETALYMCPGCGGISTIGSHGKLLACACGFRTTYDERGELHGARFSNPAEWDKWQCAAFEEWVRTNQGAYLYDDMFMLLAIDSNGRRRTVSGGVTRMDRHEIKVGDFTIRLTDVNRMDLNNDNSIDIRACDERFEMRSTRHASGRKYVDFYNVIMNSAQ